MGPPWASPSLLLAAGTKKITRPPVSLGVSTPLAPLCASLAFAYVVRELRLRVCGLEPQELQHSSTNINTRPHLQHWDALILVPV